MTTPRLQQVYDHEVTERRRTWVYLCGLAFAFGTVIAAVAVALQR